MNPKIKDLMGRLNGVANRKDQFEDDATLVSRDLLRETASILQAVFDPENQPSQYGTVLFSKDIPGSRPPS